MELWHEQSQSLIEIINQNPSFMDDGNYFIATLNHNYNNLNVRNGVFLSASACMSAYRSAVSDCDFNFKMMVAGASLAAAFSGPGAGVVFAGGVALAALQHERCMYLSLNNFLNCK